MDLWLLYSDSFDNKRDTPAQRMLDCAKKLKIEAELYFYPYFSIADNMLFYKGEVVRDLPKVVFLRGQDYKLQAYFESLGVKTINNSYTIKTARDKWETHKLVETLKIDQIKTRELNNLTFNEIKGFFSLPFILKYKYGCQGRGVYLIQNRNEFIKILKNIDPKDYIVQEFIKESYGKDVRVYVVGDKCIGAVERVNNNGFMSNLAQGGLAYNYELNSLLSYKSLKIKEALKGDIISVDYVMSYRGLLFCEANTNAGFASFNYLDYPMREILLEYIKKLI